MLKITTYSGQTYYTYHALEFGSTSVNVQTFEDKWITLEITDIDTIKIIDIVEIIRIFK